ncbi:hypothetical protein ACFE04_018952 [Oxalis oulophora]
MAYIKNNVKIISRRPCSTGEITRLRADAPPFHPAQHVSDADRCLFLTFSNGFPLHEYDIVEFFQGQLGPCVERIYVDRRPGCAPLFGKVKFRRFHFIVLLMGDQPSATFNVDGKTMCAKKFDQSKTNATF